MEWSVRPGNEARGSGVEPGNEARGSEVKAWE